MKSPLLISPASSPISHIHGVIPPLVTPFDAEGKIDEFALREETRFLVAVGVHGLSVGGSTGEGALLSDAELARSLRIVAEENTARLPLVCGVIRNSTADAVRAGQIAREAGAAALMVTPTFYHGADADGTFSYFQDIARETGLPIIIYNVIAQNPVGVELMKRLGEIELVAGVKQSVGGLHGLNVMLQECGRRFRVYGAQDDALFCSYELGSVGAISAILTAFPALCVEQWDAVQAGDRDRALAIHRRLTPLWRHVGAAGMAFPGPLKALMRLLGRPAGLPRRPILDPDAITLARLRRTLEDAGFATV